MPGSTPPRPGRPGPPSVAEIAALTARLRRLSDAGALADDAEREAFLVDKNTLLDRLAVTEQITSTSDGKAVPEPEWHPLGSARLDLPAPAALHLTTEQVARSDRAMAEALARQGIALTGDVVDVEQGRREQLYRWASDDQSHLAVDDDSRVRDGQEGAS